MKICNFYFTYGTTGHPFYGGWTKIEAPNMAIACAIFREIHPDKHEGLLNCCTCYTQEEFVKTSMWARGNFGVHEQEVVCMQFIPIAELTAKETLAEDEISPSAHLLFECESASDEAKQAVASLQP